ncbi:SH3 domain-containing protein [Pontibacillus litoralis]|uniref:SH3 domain-containing protein n=1 Tax=Pontibacillus litoralis JSM 072002 TaxID=1385512 RepID=A0A0A5HSW5_9BACI|nr:SH3 domain-containing protein [Pontibacillus litoralis]KGX86737.1 hypothetical protein N784_03835 [Pontibacillus litoralis JSM 072002]
MIYEVVKEHHKTNKNPLKLSVGDQITFKARVSGPEVYERWVYCLHEVSGLEGWVPEQLIYKYKDYEGVMMRSYSANELEVDIGDKFQVLEVLNGWVWGKLISSGEMGWLPKQCLEDFIE